MCSLDLFGEVAVWRETPRRARKDHSCTACGGVIAKGSAYLDHANLYDGSWSSETACFPCWWARETFAQAHEQSFAPSMLHELLRDCVKGRVDDAEREWRPSFAALLRRYRVSRDGRKHLSTQWAFRRERLAAIEKVRARPFTFGGEKP